MGRRQKFKKTFIRQIKYKEDLCKRSGESIQEGEIIIKIG